MHVFWESVYIRIYIGTAGLKESLDILNTRSGGLDKSRDGSVNTGPRNPIQDFTREKHFSVSPSLTLIVLGGGVKLTMRRKI